MKKSAFKLKSGNSPLYKNLGSSPIKQDDSITKKEYESLSSKDKLLATGAGYNPNVASGKKGLAVGYHTGGKPITKGIVKKLGKKGLIRMIPGIGWGLLAYDAAKTIHTVATKGAENTFVGQLVKATKKKKN